MTVWLDAQLSPALAMWMREAFGLDCHAVREHGLLVASDLKKALETGWAKVRALLDAGEPLVEFTDDHRLM